MRVCVCMYARALAIVYIGNYVRVMCVCGGGGGRLLSNVYYSYVAAFVKYCKNNPPHSELFRLKAKQQIDCCYFLPKPMSVRSTFYQLLFAYGGKKWKDGKKEIRSNCTAA